MVWHGIYAPKGTPTDAIDKFDAAVLRAALKDPAVAARMAELGGDIVPSAEADARGPAQLAASPRSTSGCTDPRCGSVCRP
mgnify:CR=1 FL=1